MLKLTKIGRPLHNAPTAAAGIVVKAAYTSITRELAADTVTTGIVVANALKRTTDRWTVKSPA